MIPPTTIASYLDRAAVLLDEDLDPKFVASALRNLARELRESRSTMRDPRTC